MKIAGMTDSLLYLLMLQCLQLSLTSCIKPLNIKVTLQPEFGTKLVLDLPLFKVGSLSSKDNVKVIQTFVEKHGLSDEVKINILEYALSHASSAQTYTSSMQGNMYVLLESPTPANEAAENLTKAIAHLQSDAFPAVVWTTSTDPQHKIVLHDDEFISKEIRLKGSFGNIALMKKLVLEAREYYQNDANTVIDIGANLGSLSLFAFALGERVLAFEASPKLLNMLEASCILNGFCSLSDDRSMKIISGAVANVSQQSVFLTEEWFTSEGLTNSGVGTCTSIEEDSLVNIDRERLKRSEVRTLTIDSIAEQYGLLNSSKSSRVSVMKLDCEGCEAMALQGASLLFATNPPYAIMSEINQARLAASGWDVMSYLQLIESLGYEVFEDINGSKLSPVAESDILDRVQQGILRDTAIDITAFRLKS